MGRLTSSNLEFHGRVFILVNLMPLRFVWLAASMMCCRILVEAFLHQQRYVIGRVLPRLSDLQSHPLTHFLQSS